MAMAMALRTLSSNFKRGVAAVVAPPGARTAATATPSAASEHHLPVFSKLKFRGEFMPMYVSLGLVLLSTSLGVATARLHLEYSPNVFVDKKKRETVPEAVAPDWAVGTADQFLKRSVFRKVARLQDFDRTRAVPDPIRPPPEHIKPKAETLKDVGVELPGLEELRAPGMLGRIRDKLMMRREQA